ncbi:hypothetical protein BZA05DRAFT_321457, partial [Tricharina praecox]|uniref:uncharacterized protein n=1 Tax=Tricharina praecox TaxID=43433 RepID=UPI0022200ADA
SYIPSQLEAPATAALTLRASPFKLLLDDAKLVLSLVRWIPGIFLPLRSKNRYAESSPTRANLQDISLHISLFFLTISALSLGARILLAFPGWVTILYALVCWLALMALCRPLNYGPRVLHSAVDLTAYPTHPRERWIFVNGICAGTRWLQENLDMISTIFRRPVTGVHNRTYGLIFDLFECLVQRDFSYMTDDIRIAYNTLKETLLDEDVDKVVLVTHSQGGIIVAAAVDALCADLPPAAFDKLEIYTFGCAANHFNNPPRCIQCHNGSCNPLPGLPRHPPSNKRQISVIEHYANSNEFVARLGVLRFVKGQGENEFVGKVFTRLGESGHLFCQHYLDPMFGDHATFLDEEVVVEEGVVVGRAADAQGVEGVRDGERQSERAR